MSFNEYGAQGTDVPQNTLIHFSSSGRDVLSAVPSRAEGKSQLMDFVTFLAVAQKLDIDFLPINWQPALSEIGEGGTAGIRQSLISLQMSFAFKVIKTAEWMDAIDESQRPRKTRLSYQALIAEISVLRHPSVCEHPNIISLLGICWDILPSGRVWPVLVFEKTALRDLWNFIKSEVGKTTPFDTRIKLCADVAVAVRDLHQSGIIHGDIKPQNVLIFKSDSGAYIAKVADFGYSTIFTGSGGIIMPRSNPWAAPEWIIGHEFAFSEAQKMDAYSFGMLCVWLLFDVSLDYLETTSEPYKDKAAFAIDLVNSQIFLQAQQRENLRVLFSLTLRNDPNNRNQDFNLILDCLTMRRRSDACQSINNSFHDVIMSPLFSITRSAWQLYSADIRVRSYIARALKEHMHTTANEQIAQHYAFELALCFRLGFGVTRSDKYKDYLEKSQYDDSHLQKEIGGLKDLYLYYQDATIRQLLSRGHLRSPSLPEQSSTREEKERIVQEHERELLNIQVEIPGDCDLVRKLKSILAVWLKQQDRWKEAEAIQQTLLEHEQRANGPEHRNALSCMEDLSSTYKSQSRWKEAEELDIHVMKTSKRVFGEEHYYTMRSAANLAATYVNQSRWMEAEELEKESMKISLKIFGPEHSETLNIMTNLSVTYSLQGRWNEAERLGAQIMKTRQEVLSLEHPSTLSSIMNYASTLNDQGQWQQAGELLIEVLTTSLRTLGAEHSITLTSMDNLTTIYTSQEQLEEAEKLGNYVVETRKRILGAEHQDTLCSISNLATIYWRQGRLEEAEDLDVKVLKTMERTLGVKHHDTLSSMSHLASTYSDQGQFEKAEKLWLQVVKLTRETFGIKHPSTLSNMTKLASTYWKQERLEEAEELETEVVKIRKEAFGAEHPATLKSINDLAITYRHQERLQEAEELDIKVMEIRKRIHGLGNLDTLTSMVNLANVYRNQGRIEEAEELWEQVQQASRHVERDGQPRFKLTRRSSEENVDSVDGQSH